MQAEESLNSYRQLSGDKYAKGTPLNRRERDTTPLGNVPAEMSPTYDGMEIKPSNLTVVQPMRTALLVLSVLTI